MLGAFTYDADVEPLRPSVPRCQLPCAIEVESVSVEDSEGGSLMGTGC